MPSVTLEILLMGAYNGLVSSDMHPRRLIAPGRARRANMALRIVGNTLRLTLSAGLLLAAGLGVLALACLAMIGLNRGLGLNQGPAVLCVTLLGCALLLPLAQRTWSLKDLSPYIKVIRSP